MTFVVLRIPGFFAWKPWAIQHSEDYDKRNSRITQRYWTRTAAYAHAAYLNTIVRE